jgi:hypothetical protein
MRVALIFDKTRPDTTGGYFERACQALQIEYEHWWVRDAVNIRPEYDLYLRIDHGDDYLTTLPDRLRPAAFYAIDTHLAHSWRKIRRMAPRYDVVFCAQRAAACRLPRGEWLPLACDPSLSEPSAQHGPWDVAFVGTEGGLPRKFVLQALRERYPRSCIGPAPHTQLMSIYRQAKIGFNYSIHEDVNMRIFEVLGSGSLLLTNALPDDDLTQLGLHEGRHLVLYHRLADIMTRIDAFLAQEETRVRIARAGMEVAHQRHTYIRRLQQLFEVISSRLGVKGSKTTLSAPEQVPCAPSS